MGIKPMLLNMCFITTFQFKNITSILTTKVMMKNECKLALTTPMIIYDYIVELVMD
jgi:hypothetical protein